MMPMADPTLAAAIGWSLVGWGPSSMAAILMTVTAHFESNEFAKSLGLSHMKTLNMPWGVAVNFGIKELQITALRYRNI